MPENFRAATTVPRSTVPEFDPNVPIQPVTLSSLQHRNVAPPDTAAAESFLQAAQTLSGLSPTLHRYAAARQRTEDEAAQVSIQAAMRDLNPAEAAEWARITAEELNSKLKERGLPGLGVGPQRFRMTQALLGLRLANDTRDQVWELSRQLASSGDYLDGQAIRSQVRTVLDQRRQGLSAFATEAFGQAADQIEEEAVGKVLAHQEVVVKQRTVDETGRHIGTLLIDDVTGTEDVDLEAIQMLDQFAHSRIQDAPLEREARERAIRSAVLAAVNGARSGEEVDYRLERATALIMRLEGLVEPGSGQAWSELHAPMFADLYSEVEATAARRKGVIENRSSRAFEEVYRDVGAFPSVLALALQADSEEAAVQVALEGVEDLLAQKGAVIEPRHSAMVRREVELAWYDQTRQRWQSPEYANDLADLQLGIARGEIDYEHFNALAPGLSPGDRATLGAEFTPATRAMNSDSARAAVDERARLLALRLVPGYDPRADTSPARLDAFTGLVQVLKQATRDGLRSQLEGLGLTTQEQANAALQTWIDSPPGVVDLDAVPIPPVLAGLDAGYWTARAQDFETNHRDVVAQGTALVLEWFGTPEGMSELTGGAPRYSVAQETDARAAVSLFIEQTIPSLPGSLAERETALVDLMRTGSHAFRESVLQSGLNVLGEGRSREVLAGAQGGPDAEKTFQEKVVEQRGQSGTPVPGAAGQDLLARADLRRPATDLGGQAYGFVEAVKEMDNKPPEVAADLVIAGLAPDAPVIDREVFQKFAREKEKARTLAAEFLAGVGSRTTLSWKPGAFVREPNFLDRAIFRTPSFALWDGKPISLDKKHSNTGVPSVDDEIFRYQVIYALTWHGTSIEALEGGGKVLIGRSTGQPGELEIKAPEDGRGWAIPGVYWHPEVMPYWHSRSAFAKASEADFERIHAGLRRQFPDVADAVEREARLRGMSVTDYIGFSQLALIDRRGLEDS